MNSAPDSIQVLHVDDEPDLADLTATYVEREDERIDVVTATSADEGLDVLAEAEIDCVVSDYDMPGRDGLEFLEAVREEYDDRPFILFTGKGNEEIASEAISAGVTDYLQKDTGTDQYAMVANRVTNAVKRDSTNPRSRAREDTVERRAPRTPGPAGDAVEPKEREGELQTERDRFRAVFEKAFDAMLIADDDGAYVDANENAAELFGVPKDELIGRSIAEFASDDFDFETAWQEFQSSEADRGEFPLVRADGSERVVEYAATSDIVPGQHLSILRDVTERRAYERDLERQNERLDEFASIVSHDLRNPLGVARGRTKLLREECDSDHMDALERAHDRMSTLIDDLLVLAREGTEAAEIEPVDLAATIEACWRNVDTRDASLVVDSDRTVLADESRLSRLLENLIRNAVYHGDPGATVTVGDLESGFYVEDDGPGIPDERQNRVFQSGYSTSEEGTGLGLSIVEGIATAHGWSVTVTAATDGGARFEITDVEDVE